MNLNRSRIYTQPSLADAMVRAINRNDHARWLDPCVGLGAFTDSLARVGIPAEQITAIDLSARVAARDHLATTLRSTDFVRWAQLTRDRFDCIVANPPYASLHSLPTRAAKAVNAFRRKQSRAISLDGNYWCVFLDLALGLLRPEGDLCFVLPASWEFADYASRLRDSTPRLFRTFETHRCMKPLFSDVQEGSIVIVGRGFGGHHTEATYFEYPDAKALAADIASPHQHQYLSRREVHLQTPSPRPRTRLGDIIDIRIGAVTGDADYFLLTELERIHLGLPTLSVTPVITHVRDLLTWQISKPQWERLRNDGRRIWLFRPPDRVLKNRSVSEYLDAAKENGGCNREATKVRSRDPWHRTALPRHPHAFVSGMSRHGPWLCMNQYDGLNASNTLYAIRFRQKVSASDRVGWALALLTSEARTRLNQVGRRYPDGLVKYEPGDLADLELPTPPTISGARRIYQAAIAALLLGRTADASELADNWFSGDYPNANRLGQTRSQRPSRSDVARTNGQTRAAG